jgi:hypothetical protein
MYKIAHKTTKKAPAAAHDDPRLSTLRLLIRRNQVPDFPSIFKHIPVSLIAKLMGMNYTRMKKLVKKPSEITVDEIYRLADIIGVDGMKVWRLVDAS